MHFCLDALRYFMKYDSQPLQPYIIFQVYAYKTYHKHGFLVGDGDGLLVIDPTKTLAVLDEFSANFEAILKACDAGGAAGGAELERILGEMRPPTEFVNSVVKMCQN